MSRPELGVQIWGTEPAALAARAREVEALGFDAVSVPDHLVDHLPAPLIACAVIARATERVRRSVVRAGMKVLPRGRAF